MIQITQDIRSTEYGYCFYALINLDAGLFPLYNKQNSVEGTYC